MDVSVIVSMSVNVSVSMNMLKSKEAWPRVQETLVGIDTIASARGAC